VYHRQQLPGPKRTGLWIALLYIILVARLHRIPVAEAVATLGVSRTRFREVWGALLPSPPPSGLSPEHAFDQALTALIEECSLPGELAANARGALG